MAYFASSGSGPGILGETLAAALNVNAMLWRTSPAATELEDVTLGWLRRMLGLPDAFHGIVYDTASIAGFTALAAARESLDLDIRARGMAGRVSAGGPLTHTTAHAATTKRRNIGGKRGYTCLKSTAQVQRWCSRT